MTRGIVASVVILLLSLFVPLLPGLASAGIEPGDGSSVGASDDRRAVIYRNGVDFARKGLFKEAAAELSLLNSGGHMDLPLAEALRAFEEADAGRLDRDAVIHLFTGIYASGSGEYMRAMDELSLATELAPKMSLAYFYRAGIYIAAGENDYAVSELDRAIELDPGFAVAYSTRGATLYKMMEFKRALRNLNIAIDVDPSLATAYYNRGVVYSRAQLYTLAISDFTRALELMPDYRDAYNNRGILYIKVSKDMRHGCSDFKRLCDLGRCVEYDRLAMQGYCGDYSGTVVELPAAR